ncbi:MAG: hypothetical protein KDJ74_12595 [Notoacmeibacter sp.]|nr:hypothetical protein [Notoacmeibacter sp.]
MSDKWQWWSGRDGETYTQGPFDTRDDAIDEAFAQDDIEEEQLPDGTWVGHVYVAEHAGTFYDCDECGRVEQACAGCRNSLLWDEPSFFFASTRSEERITRKLGDN